MPTAELGVWQVHSCSLVVEGFVVLPLTGRLPHAWHSVKALSPHLFGYILGVRNSGYTYLTDGKMEACGVQAPAQDCKSRTRCSLNLNLGKFAGEGVRGGRKGERDLKREKEREGIRKRTWMKNVQHHFIRDMKIKTTKRYSPHISHDGYYQ